MQTSFAFRSSDPRTSIEANPDPRSGCAADVLDSIERFGAQTADELAIRLPHHLASTIAGCCSRYLSDTGQRRLTRRNREAIVWTR